jgi:hypothetical protein
MKENPLNKEINGVLFRLNNSIFLCNICEGKLLKDNKCLELDLSKKEFLENKKLMNLLEEDSFNFISFVNYREKNKIIEMDLVSSFRIKKKIEEIYTSERFEMFINELYLNCI